MQKYPLYCVITGWILFVQGIILYHYMPCRLTLVHTILGITTILHHSRRDRWYYYDAIKLLDHAVMYYYIYLLSVYFGYEILVFSLLTVIIGNFFIYLISMTKNYNLMSIINCSLHIYLIVIAPKLYDFALFSFAPTG